MADIAFFIEQLHPSHDKSAFDCGEPSLNTYIQRYASQNVKNDSARIYVAVTPENPRVCGYFSLSAGRVNLTDFPTRESRGWPQQVPSVHLGRIAVDREFQGQGLGDLLMSAAIEITLETADKIGVAALELWALNDDLLNFYARYRLTSLLDDSRHLYLPVRDARKLFSR